MPLVADTGKLKAGDKTLGHNFDPRSGTFRTDQIGSFHSFTKVAESTAVSLIGEARIPKRNKAVCAAILDLYRAGDLNVSFEILAEHTVDQNGVTVIDAADGNE